MKLVRKIFIVLLVASYLGAASSLIVGAVEIGKILIAPALILTGWMFLGHLMTLDDEFPGGWSNLEGSKKILRDSIKQLSQKFLLFLATIALFLALLAQ